jgi:hypothetical protein
LGNINTTGKKHRQTGILFFSQNEPCGQELGLLKTGQGIIEGAARVTDREGLPGNSCLAAPAAPGASKAPRKKVARN